MDLLELGERTRELDDKDAEIEELKEKNYALQIDYRNKARELLNCSRSLLDKDDQIDQLNRQIDNLETLWEANQELKSENANLKLENVNLKSENANLKLENVNLKSENANLKSSVKEKDNQIVELRRRQRVPTVIEIGPEVNTELQSKNGNLEACVIENALFKTSVKEKRFQIVDCVQVKQHIDHLNKQIEVLQSEVQIQSDGNRILRLKYGDLKNPLKPNGTEPVNKGNKCRELEEYVDKDAVVLPPIRMIITRPVVEEMPQAESTTNFQTETELISPSSDEPDAQRSVQNENSTKKLSKPLYSEEEINQIVHYIFNVYKPLEPNPPFGKPYFRGLSKKLEEDNVCERTTSGLYNSFRKMRVYDLYKNKQLHTAEHRKIAKMAFETYDTKQAHKLIEQYDRARASDITNEGITQMESSNKQVRIENSEQIEEEMPEEESTKDSQTETEMISLSSDEDEECKSAEEDEEYINPLESLQNQIQEQEYKESNQKEEVPEPEPEVMKSVPNKNPDQNLPKRPYSEEEIQQIIHYIFNVYKPLEPNPPFGHQYFRILSRKLEEDGVCERNAGSLYGTFKQLRVYYLYKNMQLQTAEHREIAVKAFKFFDCRRSRKLIEQYDQARAPGITDEQIAQMESLIEKPVRDEISKTPYQRFSQKEDNKIIDLIFNQISVDSPKKRKSDAYWKQIRDEMMKHTNIKRKFVVCATHFKGVLLPNLHKRKDLHTAEHRRIAVELYGLWWKTDKKEQYIRLYDSARQSRSTL